jgi:glyoxylase-like metal-dependent hydrolase (beta-lactamase superfamily II)
MSQCRATAILHDLLQKLIPPSLKRMHSDLSTSTEMVDESNGLMRGKLCFIPLLLVSLLLASTALAAENKFVNEQYELVPIAEGVYSFIAPESDSGVVQSNCTVIIGADSVLVVDTGQFPSLAQRMIADIKKLTPKPVRYIVNTHWHFDHVWGNGAFREAYPAVAIISTEFTRQLVESEGPKTIANQPATNSKQVADIRKLVAGGKSPDGSTLSGNAKRSYTRLADTLEHVNAEFPYTVHTPPTIGFDKELTINLGHREVRIMWLGRANTAGDAIVWLPDAKLLLTGDTVVYPAPFAFGSYISEWPATLQKMIDLNPAIIIPGHGPVLRDTSYLKLIAEMCQSLFNQVKTALAQGATLDDLHKKITLPDFKQRLAPLATTNLMRDSAFNSFLYPAIDRAYQEVTGHLKPETED